MRNPIHFASFDLSLVRPLCGEWRDRSGCTTAPEAVTCVECLVRMEHRALVRKLPRNRVRLSRVAATERAS